MKYAADWWGCQIAAETDDEVDLLIKLNDLMDGNCFYSYESHGDEKTLELFKPSESNGNLFLDPCSKCKGEKCQDCNTSEKVPSIKMILEISR